MPRIPNVGNSGETEIQDGDIVIHRWDPNQPEWYRRVTRANHRLSATTGRPTTLVDAFDDIVPSGMVEYLSSELRFVRRPAPGEVFRSARPAPITAGMVGTLPNNAIMLEMYEALPETGNYRSITKAEAKFWLAYDASLEFGNFAEFRQMILNCWAGVGIRFCTACLALDRIQGQDSCPEHVYCHNCGGTGAPCPATPRCERRCNTCCGHRKCECGCGEITKDVCRGCNMRKSHGCECPTCEAPRGCIHTGLRCCGRCTGHCTCAVQCFPNVPVAGKTFFEAGKHYKGLKRLLGTELEIAGSTGYSPLLRKAVTEWQASIVGDGSIRGSRTLRPANHPEAARDGRELVTAPAGGEKWLQMIAEIGAGLAESGAAVNSSCGQHVHVDARDLGIWELARLIRLYAHVEETLFEMLPRDRYDQRFSKLCGQKYLGWLQNDHGKLQKRMTKHDLAMKLYGLQPFKPAGKDPVYIKEAVKKNQALVENTSVHKYHNSRYNALNLHSYWHRGTIEFRHGHGTTNPRQIINWGLVCGSIVEFGATGTDAGLKEALQLHPRDTLRKMLGLPPDTLEWIEERWEKFTKAAGTRHKKEPVRDEKGEV